MGCHIEQAYQRAQRAHDARHPPDYHDDDCSGDYDEERCIGCYYGEWCKTEAKGR